jgi:hypothetical protein
LGEVWPEAKHGPRRPVLCSGLLRRMDQGLELHFARAARVRSRYGRGLPSLNSVRHHYGLITAASVASLTAEFHRAVSVTVNNRSNHPPMSNHSELRIESPSR